MSPAEILSRLRRFLLGFSALLFGGAAVELWLVEHTKDAVQLIPFVLCGLGSAAALIALLRPRGVTMWGLRMCMGLIACGSLLGVYLHVDSNISFQREINPNEPPRERLLNALGGASPLLAPGILAVAAVLALAVTYHHPALEKGSTE